MTAPISALCLLLTAGTLLGLDPKQAQYRRESTNSSNSSGKVTKSSDAAISVASLISCAISCTAMEPWFCGDFTYHDNGSCDLYKGNETVTCVNPEEAAPPLEVDSSEPRSYRRLLPTCPACGGTAGTEGRITSPNYPNNYTKKTDIFWIVLAEPGQTLTAKIIDFALEAGNAMCSNYDYLEFRDGDSVSAPSLGRFCGTDAPSTVGPTTRDALTVIFHSDRGMEKRGFDIVWKIFGAEEGDTCDTAERSGAVHSVNYPRNYSNAKDAYWHLVAAHSGRTFTLAFHDFELENHSTCGHDTLEIMEDVTTDTPVGLFCGADMPDPYGPTSGAQLSIKMHADAGTNGRGFSAEWTAICSSTGE